MLGGHSSNEKPGAESRVFGTLWALIFAIPFSLAALLMIGVTGRSLWRGELFPAVIGGGFALGFGGMSAILWGSIFSLWQRPARDALRGPIEGGTRAELRQSWLAVIISAGVGVLFLALTVLVWRQGNRLWIPVLLLMPSVAGFVLANAVGKTKAWRQFGPSRLHGSPALVGGEVAGVITLGRGMTPGQPVTLRWLCKEERRSGLSSTRLVTIAESPASASLAQSVHGQFEIPFRLIVPADAPPTGEKHIWFLRAESATAPAKYEVEFVVPVGRHGGGAA